MKSTIIELRNEDGDVIKHVVVELELTTPVHVTILPTSYSEIENARQKATKLDEELATLRDGSSTSEGFAARLEALYDRVDEICHKRSLDEAMNANPYDDLVDLAEKVAAVILYKSVNGIVSSAEEAASDAKRMMGDALEPLYVITWAVSPTQVDDVLTTALSEVGIPVAA